jgi:putative intracellular protease/amidase
MTNKTAYLYSFDGMADWEYGYLVAELNSGRYFAKKGERLELLTLARSAEPVRTMGGLCIMPDLSLDDFDDERCAMLILPGGDSWLEPGHEAILEKARSLLEGGVTVAAICAATVALARTGILDNREHTSNDLGFLKAVCPEYRGEAHYRHKPAVADKCLVTAAGTAPLEFAHRALEALGVMRGETLQAWLSFNREKGVEDYREKGFKAYTRLMASLEPARGDGNPESKR